MIAFEIPGPPVPFARAGSHGSRRFTPSKQAAYAHAVGTIARSAMARAGQQPFTGAVEVIYRATFAPPKSDPGRRGPKTSRFDLDNGVKIILDSLSGIVFHDDAQVTSIHAQKQWGLPEGVVATIMPIDAVPA